MTTFATAANRHTKPQEHAHFSGVTVNPVWTVARKELLEIRRDARWRALGAVTVLLTLSALALGILQCRRLDREHQAAEAGDRHVWAAQGAKNPHQAAHFGQYAFKPVGPLALAEPGVDAFAGSSVYLEAHRQNEAQFRIARDSTLAARMGRLTFAFVLQTVLPLVAILLGFAAFSGEREKGTLPQLLSVGVRPIHLLLGKGAAGAGLLFGLLSLACVGLAAGLALFGAAHGAEAGGGLNASRLAPAPKGQSHMSAGQRPGEERANNRITSPERAAQSLPDDGLRLAGMFLGYTLYLVGFLALSLAVSAQARSSRSALVGLLVFWLLNTIVAPRLAADIAKRARSLPTAQAFRNAIAEEKKSQFGHDERHPGFIAFRDRVLRQYQVKRVEDLPVSFRGLSLREDDEAGYRIFDQHFGRLQALVETQDALCAAPGLIFPLLALQPLSMAMAGTDNRHHGHFVRAAESHRRLIQTAASQDLIDHAKNGDDNYVAPATLWENIPAFEYTPPDASWAWRSQWGNFAALLGWCSVCWILAYFACMRLRVL